MYLDGAGVQQNLDTAVKLFKQAVAKENAEAQYALGSLYASGSGVEQDNNETIRLWRAAAAQGHVKAKEDLAKKFDIIVKAGAKKPQAGAVAVGGGDKEFEAIRRAAESGDAEAQFKLAKFYETGKGVLQNTDQAIRWYQKAAAQGHVDAQYEFAGALGRENPEAVFLMGKMYLDGAGGVKKDVAEAIKRFKQAAVKGHVEAQYLLGVIYAEGEGVEKDNAAAAKWWEMAAKQGHLKAKNALKMGQVLKAAESGDAEAQYKLAGFYEEGNGFPKDAVKAFAWYKRSAEQGSAKAQFKTGENLVLGSGTSKSLEQAAKWYQRAAVAGHNVARYKLGVMYENGKGVKRDYGAAVKLYSEAAQEGNVEAQYRLGVLKSCGKGTKKSYSEAVKWWQAAAKKGNAMAAFFLGYMYETGSGVKADLTAAKKYYGQAARKGNVFAKQTMASLAK